MVNGNWMALATGTLLLATGAFADDPESSDAEALPEITLSVDSLPEEWGYSSRWQRFYVMGPAAYPPSWRLPMDDLDFRDGGTLERVSKLRHLSLLTLAEFGDRRLFLGVNDDGLLGLHFNAFPGDRKERYLEVVRMPYLQEEGVGDDAAGDAETDRGP